MSRAGEYPVAEKIPKGRLLILVMRFLVFWTV